jgi:hypothetical protein
MSEILVRPIEATMESGETVRAYVIPDDYVVCLMPAEAAAKYADWTECAAIRIVVEGQEADLQVTDDLEWLTGEEGPQEAMAKVADYEVRL